MDASVSADAVVMADAALPDAAVAAKAIHTVGAYTKFAGTSAVSAGYLYGLPITVTTSSLLLGFGMIATSSGPGGNQGRIALYRDQGGAPGALVAASSLFGVFVGRNEPSVGVLGAGLDLAPATYWIMGIYANDIEIATGIGVPEGPRAFSVYAINDPLPDPFPTASAQTNLPINYYVTILSSP
jgi:hypothetical protein